jgi:hypothetical protein
MYRVFELDEIRRFWFSDYGPNRSIVLVAAPPVRSFTHWNGSHFDRAGLKSLGLVLAVAEQLTLLDAAHCTRLHSEYSGMARVVGYEQAMYLAINFKFQEQARWHPKCFVRFAPQRC